MNTIHAFIRRHTVLSYYAVVFAISWGGILIVIGGPGAIPGSPEQAERLMPAALLALFAGPSIAGLLLTGLLDGRAGYRSLGARITRWRLGARWYAFALLFAPLLVTSLLLALSLTDPVFLPRIITTEGRAALLLFGISWGLIGGGLLEELGWTGVAVPVLRKRHGILATGLIVGLLWGVWHYLIAFWMISSTTRGAISAGIFLPALVFYTLSLPAYRVLMVWLYDRTASLLAAMLIHAVFSASSLILEPLVLGVVPGLSYQLVLGAALWLAVGAVALANHGHLTRPSLRTQAA